MDPTPLNYQSGFGNEYASEAVARALPLGRNSPQRPPLNSADTADFGQRMRPGAAAADAPVTRADGGAGWLLREIGGGFTALVFDAADADAVTRRLQAAAAGVAALRVLHVRPCGAAAPAGAADHLTDRDGLVAERYDLLPGTVYLLRPDQHVCARWRQPSAEALREALRRALALH